MTDSRLFVLTFTFSFKSEHIWLLFRVEGYNGPSKNSPDSIRLDCQLGGWWLFKGISSRAISCSSSYVPHGGCQSSRGVAAGGGVALIFSLWCPVLDILPPPPSVSRVGRKRLKLLLLRRASSCCSVLQIFLFLVLQDETPDRPMFSSSVWKKMTLVFTPLGDQTERYKPSTRDNYWDSRLDFQGEVCLNDIHLVCFS